MKVTLVGMQVAGKNILAERTPETIPRTTNNAAGTPSELFHFHAPPFYFALIRMRKSLTVTTFPLRDRIFVYVFPIVAVDIFFLIRSLNLYG